MSASIFANNFYPFSLALSLLSAIPYPTLRELRGIGTPYGKMAKRHAQASRTLRILSRPPYVRTLSVKLCQHESLSTEEAEAVPEPSTILVRFVSEYFLVGAPIERKQILSRLGAETEVLGNVRFCARWLHCKPFP